MLPRLVAIGSALTLGPDRCGRLDHRGPRRRGDRHHHLDHLQHHRRVPACAVRATTPDLGAVRQRDPAAPRGRVRDADRAARLREPAGHQDRARGLTGPAPDPGQRLPGHHAGQPRRPRRLGVRAVEPVGATAGGLLLDHVRTTDSVGDLESIRIALGQQESTFYGCSYGTYLAQVYATLHPDRVRRFVLDGLVDPRTVFYRSNLDQDVAFDENMPVLYRWIADHDAVYHLGTSAASIEKTHYRIYPQLRSQPADGGRIGPDEPNDVLLSAAYDVFGWADLALAFSHAANDGDFSAIRQSYGGPGGPGSDNGYAMSLATQCTDAPWPTAWPTWATDNWTIYGQHPFLTWGNAWYNAP